MNALVAIDFHGDQIVTFRQDGEPYVAMRRVVENLGMSWGHQSTILREEAERSSCSEIRTTGQDGKTYEMLSMPVSKLALWLASINPKRIRNPVKRARVELYQAESAIVLHDYWTKGVAVRGDMEGVVTNLDPAVMKALGGMVKGIVLKALVDVRRELADGALLADHATVARGMTAGEVVEAAGIKDRRGLRGLPRRVSDHLRRYSAKKGRAVNLGRMGSTSAYIFDGATVREWLQDAGGRQFIHRMVTEKRGQGYLQLQKEEKQ